MSRPTPLQLERSLEKLTLDIVQGQAHRSRMLKDGYTGEFMQQFQAGLSGNAGNTWGFTDQGFSFEYPFLYAPVQRRIDFPTPHFTCGFELTNPSATALVLFQAHVIDWSYSPENWIIGAKVRFAVMSPAATTQPVPYGAVAHLAFQGYASLPEGGEFS